MKRLFLTVLSCLLLVGCSASTGAQKHVNTDEKETSYPVSSYLNENKEMKQVAESGGLGTAEVEGNTLEGWAEKADIIILGSIISLDCAETILGDGMQSEIGYTLGKLLVQDTYKGASLNGEVIQYVKTGGVISMAQHDAASMPEAVQKRERLREESGNVQDTSKIYMNTTLEQDIQLEEGKSYVLALHYVEELDKYLIIGFNTMSREVDLAKANNVRNIQIDTTSTKVKNNETGQYEILSDVLDEMKIKE